MAVKKVMCAASLLVITLFAQSCESVSADDMITKTAQADTVATLQADPEKARSYNYCDWAFERGGKAVALPDYAAMLDRDTTTLTPNAWTATALVDAGTRIAQNSPTPKACAKTFKKGTQNFNKQMKKSLRSHQAKAKFKRSDNPEIASVQDALASHWIDDQAARRVYIASRTDDKLGADAWTRRLAAAQTALADANSTKFMKSILTEYDWIDRKRFGDRVSMAAWLMVQHADRHVDLQKLALTRMEPYLKTDGVKKGDYAFLWDRVAVNSGEKQRYGTQPTWECTPEGNLTLQPLEDPDTVNERRAAMGLDTVESGLAEMARSVCG